MRQKTILPIILLIALLLISGCQRGDIKVSTIIEGQPAPHAGYNIGPDLYLESGDTAEVTGAIIWINGLDPNDLLE
jgi:hypothetical protein